MSPEQLQSLRRFIRDWRTADFYRIRGGDPKYLPRFLKRGLIESRRCCEWYYRLTDAGAEAVQQSGLAGEPIVVRRKGNGGWKQCGRGHKYQGLKCRKCAAK